MRKENKLLIGVLTLLFVTDWTGTQLSDKNPADCDPTTFNCDKNEGNRQDLANQNIPESGQLQFYMDSAGDCNTQVRETGERSIMVYGRGAIQVGASPLTCVLSLKVDRPRDPQKYKISLRDMNIRDCNVQFYIYDGTMSQTLLGRYNCPQNSDPNYEPVLWTSGNMVTFYITRSSRENTDYNVQLQISTIRANTDWEGGHGGDDFNRYNKFEHKYIVLIIGVLYLFVTAIVVIMLTVCAYCINRDTKSWQKSRFGHVNPTMNGSGTKSTLNGSNAWATLKPLGGQSTRSQRKTPVNVKKRMLGAGEDGDSVFESDGTLPQKRPLPSDRYGRPDQYDRYGPPAPRVASERPAYRKPQSNNTARRVDTDDSYVQAGDDHPQSTFVERVITIPAKKKLPPEEDEFTSEDEEKDEEEEEVTDSSTDEEVEKASAAMNTDPDSTEQGTQDEQLSEEEEGVSVTYARPQKAHQEESRPVVQAAPQPPRPRTPPLGDLEAYAQEPRRIGTPDSQGYRHQQPAAGFQPQHAPGPDRYPQQVPYSSYANDAPPRPVQPGQRDYYPNMAPPSYQTNNRYPRYNTPEPYYPSSYEDAAYLPRSGVGRREPQGYRDPYRGPNQGPPEDPPIYSYLVQRGYNPVDMGRRSPGSSNGTNHSQEETTLSANLGSGVEIMRR